MLFQKYWEKNWMILKTNNSFRLGDKVKHINGDTIYRIRTMNTKFIIAVDKDGNTKTDYAKKFEKVDQEIQLGAILVFTTIIIFLCLFVILIPIMIDQVEDLSKNFLGRTHCLARRQRKVQKIY